MSTSSPNLTAHCTCGTVAFETRRAPIIATACYCHSCQTAGRQIEQLPGAPPVLDADGGTQFILYRKDRVTCIRGAEHLVDRRLTPESPTRRVLATCCNSVMFLEFSKGHWLSLYRARFAPGAPPLEMRVMTRDRPEGVTLPGDVPNYPGYSGKFMGKLFLAWIAMLLRR
ncbi:GFA family protein [Sphingomonas sp.]|uniref:GFA family protein n=1 Tax=Sphingomonas sp. TaxID=28214 RepID=UPI003D6D4A07